MRGGADPALRAPPRETDKVYTWFAIGFQEAEKFAQSSPVGLHYVAKSLHLVCNWFSGSEKQFALSLASSLHEIKISLY